MLIVMDNSTHEEHLFQTLQTNNKQFKIAVTFLTGYNGIFIVTSSIIDFYSAKLITDKDSFLQISIPPGAYEIESLNIEVKRRIIEGGHFTEADYLFTIKPNFSTLSSIIEIPRHEPVITFLPDDSIRDLLGCNASTIFEKVVYHPIWSTYYHLTKLFLNVISLKEGFLKV